MKEKGEEKMNRNRNIVKKVEGVLQLKQEVDKIIEECFS